MRTRNTDKYNEFGHHIFSSLDEAVSIPLSDGLNTIETNEREFDYFYRDRGSNVTIVTFSAAMPQSMNEYPFFSGRKMTSELSANWLSFSDPANGGEENLPTFWHLGTGRINSAEIIPRIIQHALDTGSGKHLIFFGSSAGGFAALNYSRMFPGSAALVMNPRVNVLNEPKRLPKYGPFAFPGVDAVDLNKRLPLNLAKVYSAPQSNHVFYLQNLQDQNYTRHHYTHFKKSVEGRSEVQFITGNWGAGHVTPPRTAYIEPLKSLVQSAPRWSTTYDPYEGLFF